MVVPSFIKQLTLQVGATAPFSMQVAFVDAEWYFEASLESGKYSGLWVTAYCGMPMEYWKQLLLQLSLILLPTSSED